MMDIIKSTSDKQSLVRVKFLSPLKRIVLTSKAVLHGTTCNNEVVARKIELHVKVMLHETIFDATPGLRATLQVLKSLSKTCSIFTPTECYDKSRPVCHVTRYRFLTQLELKNRR